jgi:hypothetical protein
MKEKTVYIRRKVSFSQAANSTDPEYVEYVSTAFTGIGSYFNKNKQVGTGLSRHEKNILMPEVLDMDRDERGYKEAVNNYFHEFFHKIPAGGLLLRIGLKNPKKELSEDNLPLSVTDYMVWKHALEHPQVATNLEEAESNPIVRFWIEDKEAELNAKVRVSDLEDKASMLYLQHKSDVTKVDQVLTLLGVDTRKLNPEETILRFKSVSTKRDSLDEDSQVEMLEAFISACEDKDLEIKYLILELIGAQILEKAGSNILITETGELIGEDMRDAVLFLNNKKNSKILNTLQARNKEFSKKVTN